MTDVGPAAGAAYSWEHARTKVAALRYPAADHEFGGVGAARAHPQVLGLPRATCSRRMLKPAHRIKDRAIGGRRGRERRVPAQWRDPGCGPFAIVRGKQAAGELLAVEGSV